MALPLGTLRPTAISHNGIALHSTRQVLHPSRSDRRVFSECHVTRGGFPTVRQRQTYQRARLLLRLARVPNRPASVLSAPTSLNSSSAILRGCRRNKGIRGMRSIDRLNIESLTQRSQRKLTVRDWM